LEAVHADEIFLSKMRDLASRVTQDGDFSDPDYQYRVLMSAALLRNLLLDGTPLTSIVNRDRKLKLRFRIAINENYERVALQMGPLFYTRADGLDPSTNMIDHVTKDLDATAFLHEMMMVVNGEKISVRDLIDFVANAGGAVHFDTAAKDRRPLIAAADSQISFGFGGRLGLEPSLQALRPIGRVVVAGLAPLVARIESDTKPPAPSARVD
jgi:hypothetical protein